MSLDQLRRYVVSTRIRPAEEVIAVATSPFGRPVVITNGDLRELMIDIDWLISLAEVEFATWDTTKTALGERLSTSLRVGELETEVCDLTNDRSDLESQNRLLESTAGELEDALNDIAAALGLDSDARASEILEAINRKRKRRRMKIVLAFRAQSR